MYKKVINFHLLQQKIFWFFSFSFWFQYIQRIEQMFVKNINLDIILCHKILAIGLSYNTSNSICMYIAGCLHYFYLVAAFWLNVLHLDLCRVCFKRSILKKVSSNAREAKRAKFRFKLYSCYAWGIPILGLVWL